MPDPAEIESVRYEALLESLKKQEGGEREALEEFVYILGKKNLKPHQEKLVGAAIGYFETSSRLVRGPHLKYARELAKDKHLLPDSESDTYDPKAVVSAFEQIILSFDAHNEVRKTLLNALLEAEQYSDKTLSFIDDELFSDDPGNQQREFVKEARAMVFRSVVDSVSSELDENSSQNKLRRMVLDKFAKNELSQPEMIRLVKALIEDTPDYINELLAVSKLDGVILEVREKAEAALKKPSSLRY